MSRDVLLISVQENLDVTGPRSLHYQLLRHGFASRLLFMPDFSGTAMSRAVCRLVEELSPLFVGISLMSVEYERAKHVTRSSQGPPPVDSCSLGRYSSYDCTRDMLGLRRLRMRW